MIDKLFSPNQYQGVQNVPRRTLTMVKNERMGGYVPKWEISNAPEDKIQENLSRASRGEQLNPMPENANAYYHPQSAAKNDEFGFGDLIDIVNPLHHIPVVGHVYREISGDEIKPIGNIVGGAVFGGPLGVAAGLINTVIQEETGQDAAGNAIAMVTGRKSQTPEIDQSPESLLNQAIQSVENDSDMTSALLAFSDLSHNSGIKIERAATNYSANRATYNA